MHEFAGIDVSKDHLDLALGEDGDVEPDMKIFYDRLRAAGKPPKLALVAVVRKLLASINAIVRDQKPWELAFT